MLCHFLIVTWAKVCQALGEEFEPYLPVVMPPLVRVASSKADISIYGASVLAVCSIAAPLTSRRRRRGRARRPRRLGEHQPRRPAGGREDVCTGGQVSGVRDAAHPRVDTQRALRTVCLASALQAAVLYQRWITGGSCYVSCVLLSHFRSLVGDTDSSSSSSCQSTATRSRIETHLQL